MSESLSQHPTNFPEALPPDPVAAENAALTRQDGFPKAPISRRQRLDPQSRHSGIFGMHRAGETVLRVLRRLKKGVANR
jgi:hypothetical protein